MVVMLIRSASHRFDLSSKQYVAGVMEEDNPAHPELLLNKTDVGPGRSFTLYLFDKDKNHVRSNTRHVVPPRQTEVC